MSKLQTYLSFVRFSHSVFALPFALTGALLALHERPLSGRDVAWRGPRCNIPIVPAGPAAPGSNPLPAGTDYAPGTRAALAGYSLGAPAPRAGVPFVVPRCVAVS